MTYLLRTPGMHRCVCGWEGKPAKGKKAGKPVDECPRCREITAPIPLQDIPGHCYSCAGTAGKLLFIDHIMVRECACGARLDLHTLEPWKEGEK